MFPWALFLILTVQPQSPDDVARGKKLFESQCALCHGQTGLGGRGPNLAVPKLRRAETDSQLLNVIRYGIAGSEMGGAWQMSARESEQVAAYVRALGKMPAEMLPGNAARGRAVYESQGCANCHIVAGQGAGFGPELSDIGAKRNAANLRQHLIAPGAGESGNYLMLRAATRDGRKISGVRVNEDTFTVQIREVNGRLDSLRKSDLTELKKLPGESPMPSFRALTAGEVDDLVAYLASLRGAQ